MAQPSTPCPTIGCPELCRQGVCPVHGNRRRRRNMERGGSGSAWQATRLRIFWRDGGCCVRCGVRLMPWTARIDHIRPLADGGSGDDANLQCMCYPCHRKKTPNGGG